MDVNLIKLMLSRGMDVVIENYETNKVIDFTEVNSRVEQLLQGAESCEEMIYNRKEISNDDFYNKLKKFAFINWWEDLDCYRVIEMAYNMKCAGATTIKTTMHATYQKVEGHGKDFSWWDEEVGINFEILYTEDFEVDYEHVYTVEEIKKLIAEKKIILVSIDERSVTWSSENYQKEKYQKFDYAYTKYSKNHEFFYEDGKFYKYTLRYIRKNLNKKKLEKLFEEHLAHVESEVYGVTEGGGFNDIWLEITKKYTKEFENQGYARRLAKLSAKKQGSN